MDVFQNMYKFVEDLDIDILYCMWSYYGIKISYISFTLYVYIIVVWTNNDSWEICQKKKGTKTVWSSFEEWVI